MKSQDTFDVGTVPNCQEQGGRGAQDRCIALPEVEGRDGKAGKMGSTPSGYGGLGSSRKPSPIRTPEGVARCHYRIPAPMALPGTATI